MKIEYSLTAEGRLQRISEILAQGVLRLIEEKNNGPKQARGATEITPKITTTTTTKTTAQNAVRKEARVGSPHKNEDEQEQHLHFEERRRLLLTQAEQLLKAEQSAG